MSSPQTPQFTVGIVKGAVVHDVVMGHVERCVDVVRRAYLAHAEGATINPDSYFLRFPKRPNSRIIALPASIEAGVDVSGIKWIASYPDNVARGFPRASAVLVLNDLATGYPFAILEASIISAARTACSAILAAEQLGGSRRTDHLLIVGTGLIARYVYRCMLALGWEIGRVTLHDLAPGEAEKFRDTVCDQARHPVATAAEVPAALREASLVLFTTTAGAPHLHDPALFAHAPVVLHLSLRDLAPEVLLAADNVVDDVEHVMKAATSPHLTEQKVGHRRFVNGTLADVLRGRAAFTPGRARIFSPFGLGVLDLAVGKWVFDEAVRSGRATVLDDFFFDLSR